MAKQMNYWPKWLKWHLLPRPNDLTVKSVIETILYAIVFGICYFLFYSWNQVPVRRESITVDCLSKPIDNKNEDIAPVAQITYCIPMTTTDWTSEEKSDIYRGNLVVRDEKTDSIVEERYQLNILKKQPITRGYVIDFSQWKTNYRKDNKTGVIISDIYNHDISLNDSIRNEETNKSVFWSMLFSESDFPLSGNYPYEIHITKRISREKSHPYWSNSDNTIMRNTRYNLYQSDYYTNYENERDSLKRVFRYYTDSLATTESKLCECITRLGDNYQDGHPLYYWKMTRSRLRGLWKPQIEKVDTLFVEDRSFGISHIKADDQIKIEEGFQSCKDDISAGFVLSANEDNVFSDHPYRRPSWFRLEDISQAYYDVRVNSWMIDSIVLTFDFIGATTFSKMQPEPDRITMSSVTFSDPKKMMEIKIHGLKFHARFNELENRQYIRMFAITTIMAGMVTIFLAMIIIGLMSTGISCTKQIITKFRSKLK